MVIEDLKEPCETCFHEPSCVIKHPELGKDLPVTQVQPRCEKLDKFSRYIDATRNI